MTRLKFYFWLNFTRVSILYYTVRFRVIRDRLPLHQVMFWFKYDYLDHVLDLGGPDRLAVKWDHDFTQLNNGINSTWTHI